MLWRRTGSPLAITLLVLVAAIGLVGPELARASPGRGAQAPTPFPTPTPNERGEIIYTVQAGDTPWRIAAIAGISLEELYALNGLQSTDFITPGMQLLLGSAGPPQPTSPPGVEPTVTPLPMTPTPEQGTGDICALLFVDENGNARLEVPEAALAGGQVSVAAASGNLVGEHTTDGNVEGYCFEALPNGDYNVSAGVPAGYNPTTSMNIPVRLQPGDLKFVQFGAQPSAALHDGARSNAGERSAMLGALGVFMLLAAAALGYYAARYSKRAPRSLG